MGTRGFRTRFFFSEKSSRVGSTVPILSIYLIVRRLCCSVKRRKNGSISRGAEEEEAAEEETCSASACERESATSWRGWDFIVTGHALGPDHILWAFLLIVLVRGL